MRDRKPGRSRLAAIAAALLGIAWVGCNDSQNPPAPSPAEQECGVADIFDRSNFSRSTVIDNRWYPLVPGLQFILDGTVNRGGVAVQHRVVFTVTDLTKEIQGVRAVVLWDRDYNNGQLLEAELAFQAQDDEGNVWSVGEYPEEYENGTFIGAPSAWISGQAGAEAGILVVGKPKLGAKFIQGYVPDINFLDCASVYSLNQSVCVPYNCYEGVLVIDERSPLEVGSGHQQKYYAPGVGTVKIGAVGDPEAEELLLANVLQLSPEALAAARAEALKLERRAYEICDVYRRTPPARQRP